MKKCVLLGLALLLAAAACRSTTAGDPRPCTECACPNFISLFPDLEGDQQCANTRVGSTAPCYHRESAHGR